MRKKTVLKSTVYWHETESVRISPPLNGSKHYDVCIVGAGYTGLWTAYFLQQSSPSLRIALLEARYAGAGASGHNDGFVLQALGGHGAQSLLNKYGHDDTLRILQALRSSAVEIGRFCIAKDLPVEFEASGIYAVATVDRHQRHLTAGLQSAGQLGIHGERLLSCEALRREFGSATVLAGYRVGGGLLNPFKLARALARVVVRNGAHLYERSPAIEISETKTGVSAITSSGLITCDKLVVATDAHQSWFEPLSRHSFCVRSYILVSEKLTRSQLERLKWENRSGFVDAHNHALFGRLTWDNRLLLGGGFAARARNACDSSPQREQERAERKLTGLFRYLFPALCDVKPEYVYGGIIGVSRDMLPQIGPLSPRINYAYGYSGHGIVATHLAAKAVRDLTLDTRSEALELPFIRSGPPPTVSRIPSPVQWSVRVRRGAADWAADRVVRAGLRRLDRKQPPR